MNLRLNLSSLRDALHQVKNSPAVRMAVKQYPLGRVLLFAVEHPQITIALVVVALYVTIVVPATIFLVTLSLEDVNVQQTVSATGLPTSVKPGVIPTHVLPALEHAAEKYRVPLQFLAAEAKVESGFNPKAVNHGSGTHASGMMQFEPGTWNGFGDPLTALDEFDTNPARIAHYGGYGVDADGNGTASVYAPADAAMAAAHYLRHLYQGYGHNWKLASYWYGAETQAYVRAVMRDMAGFVPPAEKMGPTADWFIGGKKGTSVVSQQPTRLTLSTTAWAPIYAPTAGTLTVTYKPSGDTVQWQNGVGLVSLTFSGGLVAWATTGTVSAGQLIGFTTTKHLIITGNVNPLSVVGGSLPTWVRIS
ncbi:transglycosylase SLT domain-containing protein [Alicyclobacillus sp. SO9]|uniref:transglycosylase SLT domain-containing protein n=1 Tax=Alicyclobacillus sp. SO9 TaxID=2665646 RepID=UPI0018E80AAB|nr:transglycosylase SLT domain-containing protein [Alicyclobacillus sp. SO9]QQE79724.1 transglycosylase SLT domain-containing protein [Alicyclobacillus sp. SO9]